MQAAHQPVAQKAVALDGSSQVQSGDVTQQGLVPDVGRSGPLEAGPVRYAKPFCLSLLVVLPSLGRLWTGSGMALILLL